MLFKHIFKFLLKVFQSVMYWFNTNTKSINTITLNPAERLVGFIVLFIVFSLGIINIYIYIIAVITMFLMIHSFTKIKEINSILEQSNENFIKTNKELKWENF